MEQAERLHYRDRLRAARYAALADAEAFPEVCYALEALGMRLSGSEGNLSDYEPRLRALAAQSENFVSLASQYPMFFTRFGALFEAVRRARNDAMHSGAYARHATSAAVEMCVGLEEAVMAAPSSIKLVSDFMVKSPVVVEDWQPVAHARQLMLTHSFSFLPILHRGKWQLVSDLALVAFLRPKPAKERRDALALPITTAITKGLQLVRARKVRPMDDVSTLWSSKRLPTAATLWLVVERPNRLAGVLSPFELM